LNAVDILCTPTRQLRAPWRILLFILVVVAMLVISAWIEMAVDELAARNGYEMVVSEWGVPLGLVAATAVMLKWVDGKSWDYVGLGGSSAQPRLLVQGTVLGLIPIAIPAAVLLATGQLDMVPTASGSSLDAAGLSFANLLPAAFGEELLLRGYIFVVLVHAVGPKWTLISTSVIFGLLHLANPGADALSISIVMLAGFFLGSVFLATRSLWAATMAHFVWNWFMAAGLHAPVSGIAVQTPDYRVVDSGPDWLTGGKWGPEGGFAAAAGMFVMIIYLHARHLRRMES
jgi:membrane protease YdiL (CAAX protease family)